MNTLIHADIFFFVTTICLAVLSVLSVIAWVYGMKILGNVRQITEKTKIESDYLLGEMHSMADRMKSRKFGVMTLFFFIKRLIRRYS